MLGYQNLLLNSGPSISYCSELLGQVTLFMLHFPIFKLGLMIGFLWGPNHLIYIYIYIYINNYMWIKWPFWKRPCTPGAHQANCLKVGRKIHCTFSCQNPYCPHSVVPLGGKPQFAYSSWWEKQVEFMFKTLTFKGDAWGTILHLIWIQVPTEMKGPD